MRRLAALVAALLLAACSPEEVIRVIFAEDPDTAVAVATCESGLDPTAVSPDGANHGLFQINNVHRRAFEARIGHPWSERYDPVVNTAYALWLWHDQGWRPWACA